MKSIEIEINQNKLYYAIVGSSNSILIEEFATFEDVERMAQHYPGCYLTKLYPPLDVETGDDKYPENWVKSNSVKEVLDYAKSTEKYNYKNHIALAKSIGLIEKDGTPAKNIHGKPVDVEAILNEIL